MVALRNQPQALTIIYVDVWLTKSAYRPKINQPESDEQSKDSSHVGQEINPGHGGLVAELHDCRGFEEEVHHG